MHRVQQFILAQLISNPASRYAALKPKTMEGSQFSYHLQKLQDSRLIQKNAEGMYQLTSAGKQLADKFELESLSILDQPRIVCLVACHDDQKGWLLLRRKLQPTIGMAGFPKVNIELGDHLLAQATEAFTKLCGLQASLEYGFHGYITQIAPDGSVESKIMFHLLVGNNPVGTLQESSDEGTFSWCAPEKLPTVEKLMPSTPDLIQILESQNKPVFFEKTYQL